MKNWYSIKAVDESVAEISVFDEIGFWGVQAKEFAAAVKAIAAPKIKLFINSPGGSVFDAVAMVNVLGMSGKTIEVHVLGIAASAASYLAMAGNTIVMPSNTFMFLHNPINGVYGNAAEMREMAEVLDKIGASMTATYAKRFKGDAKALEDLMAAESYLTAAECLEHGFCDEVVDEITATAKFDSDYVPEAVRAVAFKPAVVETPAPVAAGLPEQIKAALAANDLSEHEQVFATDLALVDEATLRASVATARDIKAYATLAGKPEKAADFIRARKSTAEARAALAALAAADDEATAIDTARKAAQQTEASKPGLQFTNGAQLWDQIKKASAK